MCVDIGSGCLSVALAAKSPGQCGIGEPGPFSWVVEPQVPADIVSQRHFFEESSFCALCGEVGYGKAAADVRDGADAFHGGGDVGPSLFACRGHPVVSVRDEVELTQPEDMDRRRIVAGAELFQDIGVARSSATGSEVMVEVG